MAVELENRRLQDELVSHYEANTELLQPDTGDQRDNNASQCRIYCASSFLSSISELPRFGNQLAGDGSEWPQATRTSGRRPRGGWGVYPFLHGEGSGDRSGECRLPKNFLLKINEISAFLWH